jgi:hypothetical protein
MDRDELRRPHEQPRFQELVICEWDAAEQTVRGGNEKETGIENTCDADESWPADHDRGNATLERESGWISHAGVMSCRSR